MWVQVEACLSNFKLRLHTQNSCSTAVGDLSPAACSRGVAFGAHQCRMLARDGTFLEPRVFTSGEALRAAM